MMPQNIGHISEFTTWSQLGGREVIREGIRLRVRRLSTVSGYRWRGNGANAHLLLVLQTSHRSSHSVPFAEQEAHAVRRDVAGGASHQDHWKGALHNCCRHFDVCWSRLLWWILTCRACLCLRPLAPGEPFRISETMQIIELFEVRKTALIRIAELIED